MYSWTLWIFNKFANDYFSGASPSRLALSRSKESKNEGITPVVPESTKPKVQRNLILNFHLFVLKLYLFLSSRLLSLVYVGNQERFCLNLSYLSSYILSSLSFICVSIKFHRICPLQMVQTSSLVKFFSAPIKIEQQTNFNVCWSKFFRLINIHLIMQLNSSSSCHVNLTTLIIANSLTDSCHISLTFFSHLFSIKLKNFCHYFKS